jgi:hypothetical protein
MTSSRKSSSKTRAPATPTPLLRWLNFGPVSSRKVGQSLLLFFDPRCYILGSRVLLAFVSERSEYGSGRVSGGRRFDVSNSGC